MQKNSQETKEQGIRMLWKVLKYFYKTAFLYKPTYFIFVTLSVIFRAGAPFVNLLIPKLIIDELMGSRDVSILTRYVLMIALGNALFTIINRGLSETVNSYGDSFHRLFAINISKKAMSMDFEYTEDPDMLDLCQKADTGMSWYSGGIAGLTFCLVRILAAILTLCGVATLIINDAPVLLLIIIINVCISAIFNTKINAIDVKFFKSLVGLNRAFSYIYWNLPSFQFGKDMRLYQAEKMVLEKGEKNNELNAEKMNLQAREILKYRQGDLLVTGVREIITYFYLGIQAIRKLISIGDFTMMVTATNTFSNSLKDIIWNSQELHKKAVFMKEYVSFMECKDKLVKGDMPLTVDEHQKYRIEFRNVSFCYPKTNEKILDNVNLTLEAGEHLAIVGLNGAGKTTFIKLLCRLYDVTEGEILINGVNIKDYSYDEYLKLFSVVFQDFKLFSFSMRENLIIDEEEITDDELLELCNLCGLGDKIRSLEKGIDTSIYKQYDEEGIEPSGGEAQKLAIARALHKKAPIVILDEPTAALDPKAEYEIYNHFDTLVGGKTAVYISHRLSSCKFCHNIAVFSEGTVKEYGSHDELIKIPNGIYGEMFTVQAQYYN